MSSSSDVGLLKGPDTAEATGLAMPELRSGQWTRLGNGSVLGDAVTEQLLDSLAESTRQSARSQGYAVGWAAGRREALASVRAVASAAAEQAAADDRRRRAEHDEAVRALTDAATGLRERLAEVCRGVDERASRLALELTRELVGALATDAAEHVLERVAGLLPERPVVEVRLHPDVAADAEKLRQHGVAVVADPTLGPADALVASDVDALDLRVATALERLREVLG